MHDIEFRPGDPGYADEVAGFQLAVAPRPSLVVAARTSADVYDAVRHARDAGLPVGVTATGHGRVATEDGGVLVNTRRMNGIAVDPDTATAWVAAGARWGAVIDAAAPHGLAPLSGGAPHVGVTGYTLGGGIGLLARRYGFASDHVTEIEVVTAAGRLQRVAAGDDLFWALLGGRDNFGVVTAMRIGLVPVTTLYGGGLYFDTDLIPEVLRTYPEWTATVPDELTSSIALIPFPDVPALPAPLRGRHVAHVRIAHLGTAQDGEPLVKPLRAIGPRLLDTVTELPYTASGTIHNDPVAPSAYHSTSALLRGFDPAAARTVLDLAGPGAPLPCVVELRHLGGALARPPAVPSAVGHRDAAYLLVVLSRLSGVDPHAETTRVATAHDAVFTALEPEIVGRSVNFLGTTTSGATVLSAYDAADRARLARLKALYDPAGMFRLNHTIPTGDIGSGA